MPNLARRTWKCTGRRKLGRCAGWRCFERAVGRTSDSCVWCLAFSLMRARSSWRAGPAAALPGSRWVVRMARMRWCALWHRALPAQSVCAHTSSNTCCAGRLPPGVFVQPRAGPAVSEGAPCGRRGVACARGARHVAARPDDAAPRAQRCHASGCVCEQGVSRRLPRRCARALFVPADWCAAVGMPAKVVLAI